MSSIDLALDDLKAQICPNILATSKKYGLVESTLRRRWNYTPSRIRLYIDFRQSEYSLERGVATNYIIRYSTGIRAGEERRY